MADSRSVLFRLEEADKMLRKGELAHARSLYVALLADAAADMQGAIQLRLDRVDELSSPGERNAARRPHDATAQSRAETAANEGRLDDAIAIYAEIIATRPDDQLARERLTELLAAKARPGRKSAPIRTVTAQDSQNVDALASQERGPLGQALHEGKGKAGPPPMDETVEELEPMELMDDDVASMPTPPPVAPAPAFDATQFGRPGSVVGFLHPEKYRSPSSANLAAVRPPSSPSLAPVQSPSSPSLAPVRALSSPSLAPVQSPSSPNLAPVRPAAPTAQPAFGSPQSSPARPAAPAAFGAPQSSPARPAAPAQFGAPASSPSRPAAPSPFGAPASSPSLPRSAPAAFGTPASSASLPRAAAPAAPARPAARPEVPLPSEPVEMLREALLRIQHNRRAPSPFGPAAS